MVTPKVPDRDEAGENVKIPPPAEVFLMTTPGESINWKDYDDERFKDYNDGFDPDLIRYQLVDNIPARAPTYVASGRSASALYKILLTNFITNSSNTKANPDYSKLLAQVLNPDYTFAPFVEWVNSSRTITRETFDRINAFRKTCLVNEHFSVCAKKIAIQAGEIETQTLMYHITRKFFTSTVASIFSAQSRNVETVMSRAYQSYLMYLRSSVGTRAMFEPFLYTKFEPSNFHCWWNPNKNGVNCPTFWSAFMSVSVTVKASETKSENSITTTTFGSTSSLRVSMLQQSATSTVSSSGNQTVSAFTETMTTTIEFELAAVRIFRPWFDSSLFDYYPLGVVGVEKGAWSDGAFGGIFPWIITKMIVAKNIKVSFSETNSVVERAFQTSRSDATSNVSLGPFRMNDRSSSGGSSSSSSSAYDYTSNTLSVPGPQIIGYVATRLSYFPNYYQETV